MLHRKKNIGWCLLSLLLVSSLTALYFMGFYQISANYDVALSNSFKLVSPVLIGAAVDSKHLQDDEAYLKLVLEHYNSMVAEYEMKMAKLIPTQGDYHFSQADYLVEFAESHGLWMHGHTLIWHLSLPQWLQNFNGSDEEFASVIQNYIQTVVGRYKGQVASWDVLNEAFIGSRYRDTIFYQRLGTNYIAKLFEWAHQADPDAKLYYNEYDILARDDKRDFVLQELKTLIDSGVPIHGLGIQGHLKLNYTDLAQIEESLTLCSALGIDIRISELDITVNHDNRHYVYTDKLAEAQKQYYHDIVAIFLKFPAIKDITTWGVFDGHTWRSEWYQADWPLLFNENYQPKPAAEGFLFALQGK